jgi:1-acyl-sn-glycerol-3-phosphate acyltransferase
MLLIRSVIFVLWLYASLAMVGLIFAPTLPFGRAGGMMACRSWARCILWGLRWIVGARVRFEGLDLIPPGPVLVASKHQAMLDTLMPFLMLKDPAIVLKRELVNAPVFGWYAVATGHIPVDREANATALRNLLKEARQRKAQGRQIFIYPEGTRTEPGAPPDYKPGVAALYRDLGVACVPMALDTGKIWPARGLIRRPGVVTIKALAPIEPGLSRDAFMTTLQDRIEGATNGLYEERAP